MDEWRTIIEHISMEAITGDTLSKALAPKLSDESVFSMRLLSSFDILG